jgi:hypothetical protein
MARDLMLWMNDMILQMNTQEKPRDVSGVELLMNNHQSLKAEIDARNENFTICVNLGKDLLARKHFRSPEVCTALFFCLCIPFNTLQLYCYVHLVIFFNMYQIFIIGA